MQDKDKPITPLSSSFNKITDNDRLLARIFENDIGSAPTMFNGRDPSNRPNWNKSDTSPQPKIRTVGFAARSTTSQ